MHEEKEVMEHVKELRKRVLVIAYFFIAALFVGFYFAKPLVYYLQTAPWMDTVDMHAFNVTDPLRIYITMIVIIAFILILPIILYQVWAFVSPGLYEKERHVTLVYIPISFILMLIGMAFGYYILVPYIVQFTFSLSDEMGITSTIGINDYFGFLVRTVLPFGFVFQMPIIVLFITQLGVITPMFLKKNRKYAYFILFVIAAIIAPPDLMTHILLTIPMILLYEISISVSKIGYRRYLKAEEAALKSSLEEDES